MRGLAAGRGRHEARKGRSGEASSGDELPSTIQSQSRGRIWVRRIRRQRSFLNHRHSTIRGKFYCEAWMSDRSSESVSGQASHLGRSRVWWWTCCIAIVCGFVGLGIAGLTTRESRKPAFVVIPTGYRGDVIIVESSDGIDPERIAGTLRYTVPESGVLRVKNIDRLTAYVVTAPAYSRDIHCVQQDGLELPNRIEPLSDLYFSLSGPFGDHRISMLSVWSKSKSGWPRITSPELGRLWKDGVPRDFVSPHIIE